MKKEHLIWGVVVLIAVFYFGITFGGEKLQHAIDVALEEGFEGGNGGFVVSNKDGELTFAVRQLYRSEDKTSRYIMYKFVADKEDQKESKVLDVLDLQKAIVHCFYEGDEYYGDYLPTAYSSESPYGEDAVYTESWGFDFGRKKFTQLDHTKVYCKSVLGE